MKEVTTKSYVRTTDSLKCPGGNLLIMVSLNTICIVCNELLHFCFKNVIYICVRICFYLYTEKKESEKYTLIISIFSEGQGLGSRIVFFFFILLHALQNCLHLLQETCMILIIFKNNVIQKRKKNLQKVVK